jgi:phage portal protein BeeE
VSILGEIRSFFGFRGVSSDISRGGSAALPTVPTSAERFGPGVFNQQNANVLLRESLGMAAACTRELSNSVARLTIEIVEEDISPAGTVKEVPRPDHPLRDLLVTRPHPNFSKTQLFYLITQWILTTGEAYVQKLGSDLRVEALLPMKPTMFEPIVNGGLLTGYLVTDANGDQQIYPADWFVRFYFPDPENPWQPEGYLAPMAIELDADKFAEQSLRSHYQHDATPKTAIEQHEALPETVGIEDAQERFHQKWREFYDQRGGSRMGVPAILPYGARLVEFGRQAGADVTPLLEHWRDDMMMNFGVPRSIMGQVQSGDRSSAETNEWVFENHQLVPITNIIRDGFNQYLVQDFEGDVKVRFKAFTTEDKAHILAQEQSDLDRKVKSINEVREDRDLEPVEWGKDPIELAQALAPASVFSSDSEGAPTEPESAEDERSRVIRERKRQSNARRRAKQKRKAESIGSEPEESLPPQ